MAKSKPLNGKKSKPAGGKVAAPFPFNKMPKKGKGK
jgi:hypothetical protein